MSSESISQFKNDIEELKKKISKLKSLEARHVRAVKRLQESEEKYRVIVENSGISVSIITYDGIFLFMNSIGAKFHGKDEPTEIFGKSMWELFPKPVADAQMKNVRETIDEKKKFTENTKIMISGKPAWFEATLVPLEKNFHKKRCAILITRDITETKLKEEENFNLQEQLRRSQKLESIGYLAGGVAHDLNNLLTPILGYSEIGLLTLKESDPSYEKFQSIYTAGRCSKELVHRLLAFGRKQVLQVKVINLNDVIGDIESILRHTIREDIDVKFTLEPSLNYVKADPFQLEQAIINMALNAQDAMQESGKLLIKTENININKNNKKLFPEMENGDYVLFSIADNGMGMDESVLARIFEPFFTTKDRDRGTGLGLAMVYGIVKQHNGNIIVSSKHGEGTEFKIFLPITNESPSSLILESNESRRGTETILIIEDDDMVRQLACRILSDHGYKVVEAKNSSNAFKLAEKYKNNIELLLTDVVMPKTNGKQVYEKILKIIPDISVLFISGYASDVISQHGILDNRTNLIPKPFSVTGLTKKVRGILDKKKKDDK